MHWLVEHPSAVASLASAAAALVSAHVATRAFRISRMSLHANVRPLLEVRYSLGDEALKFKNVGSGPALKVALQRTQIQYYGQNCLVEYRAANRQKRTFYPGEEGEFEIEPDRAVNDEDLATVLKDFNLFRFIDIVGTEKVLGIIYCDIYGKSFLLRFKFIELGDRGYAVDLLPIKTYGNFRRFLDHADFYRFRLLRVPREMIFRLRGKTKVSNEC